MSVIGPSTVTELVSGLGNRESPCEVDYPERSHQLRDLPERDGQESISHGNQHMQTRLAAERDNPPSSVPGSGAEVDHRFLTVLLSVPPIFDFQEEISIGRKGGSCGGAAAASPLPVIFGHWNASRARLGLRCSGDTCAGVLAHALGAAAEAVSL